MYSIIQGNEDKNKQNDMTLTVQNVTPIKYQVFESKTDPEEEKKSLKHTNLNRIIKLLQISPAQI